MKLENYPIKTLGEDAFSCYYISLNYFKLSNIPKVQKQSDCQNKKKHASE